MFIYSPDQLVKPPTQHIGSTLSGSCYKYLHYVVTVHGWTAPSGATTADNKLGLGEIYSETGKWQE